MDLIGEEAETTARLQLFLSFVKGDALERDYFQEVREWVFEINKEVRGGRFLKPGKWLPWKQFSGEVEYHLHGAGGSMVIPLRIDLGIGMPSIDRETMKPLDQSCCLGYLSAAAE